MSERLFKLRLGIPQEGIVLIKLDKQNKKYFKLILMFFRINLTFHRTIKSVAHSSTYEKPLEPNDFMTVCVRVECRFPEEIQMMCNIDYRRDQGRDV